MRCNKALAHCRQVIKVALPCGRVPEPSTRALRAAALVSPVLILLGILCHTVLEGLAIGLQVVP